MLSAAIAVPQHRHAIRLELQRFVVLLDGLLPLAISVQLIAFADEVAGLDLGAPDQGDERGEGGELATHGGPECTDMAPGSKTNLAWRWVENFAA